MSKPTWNELSQRYGPQRFFGPTPEDEEVPTTVIVKEETTNSVASAYKESLAPVVDSGAPPAAPGEPSSTGR